MFYYWIIADINLFPFEEIELALSCWKSCYKVSLQFECRQLFPVLVPAGVFPHLIVSAQRWIFCMGGKKK